MSDYTNGRQYLLTFAEPIGDYSQQLEYLLPSGKRIRVTIDQAHDTPETRDKIGQALAEGRTGRVRGKQ